MLKVYLIIIAFIYTQTLGTELIKHVTVVFRHGDRTPISFYPNDPYADVKFWPVALGQLTNLGKQQHFRLGGYFRDHYEKLLQTLYDPQEIRAQSTDVDRTLMSATVNLAGIYPPFGKQVWKDNVTWQPIPVHTVPEWMDEVLAMKRYCENYEIEKAKYLQSQSYLDELKKYKHLMSYLTVHTGMTISTFEDIMNIYSCLHIEQVYNFTLPAWTKAVFPDKMSKPAGFSFSTSAATPKMARLIAGPLFGRIVSTMYNVAVGNSTLKMSMYSGHDFTVGTLLTALGLFDGVAPCYTATIFFELVFDEEMVFPNDDVPSPTDGYFVRLLYRNTIEIKPPKVLIIPGCGEKCSLADFEAVYSNLMNVDFAKECAYDYTNTVVLYSLVATLTASINYIIVLFFLNKKKYFTLNFTSSWEDTETLNDDLH